MNRAERRRAAREAQKPAARRRAHLAVARAQGCRCQPDVVLHSNGVGADMHHNPGCSLEHAGTKVSLVVPGRGPDMTPVLFDADTAITVAVNTNTMVMAMFGDEPLIVIPAGTDVPPFVAEFCDIDTVHRLDGSTVKLATIPDDVALQMFGRCER